MIFMVVAVFTIQYNNGLRNNCQIRSNTTTRTARSNGQFCRCGSVEIVCEVSSTTQIETDLYNFQVSVLNSIYLYETNGF